MNQLKGIIKGQEVEIMSGSNKGKVGVAVVICEDGITVRMDNGMLDFIFESEIYA